MAGGYECMWSSSAIWNVLFVFRTLIKLKARDDTVLQMGKTPKKGGLADKVRKTKTCAEIKNNPFEVKINRKKFDVLGRKSKHDVGLPGVSRSKAITKVSTCTLCNYDLKTSIVKSNL